MYKDLEQKRILFDDSSSSFDPDEFEASLQQVSTTADSIERIDQITSLIDEFEFIKVKELNALALSSLIPDSMPRMLDSTSNPNKSGKQHPDQILYYHMQHF